jgi:2OG-Fe(II) oxygenase superfamily
MLSWLKSKPPVAPSEWFDYPALMQRAESQVANHAQGQPYPYTVLDNILPADALKPLLNEMPKAGDKEKEPERKWDFYFAKGYEEKWAISDDQSLPPSYRALVHAMNSSPFIQFLEKLSGIEHLLPDPHLHGGGIHLVPKGGVLQVHSDFNWSERLQAHRRVNVFIYLNPRWQASWGGALELWDEQCQAKVSSIDCLFNRMVVFNSRSDTFHGHPHPIVCPDGEWRQSLAMYYYTSARPEAEVRPAHNTIYKGLHVA